MQDREGTVRVHADYFAEPLWIFADGDLNNALPGQLAMSPGLVVDLRRWADEYDTILDRDDPRLSGFADAAAEESFGKRGLRLARRLAAELGGSWSVSYFDVRGAHEYPVDALP